MNRLMFARRTQFKYQHIIDMCFAGAARFMAFSLLGIAVLMVWLLYQGGIPSLKKFGFHFLANSEWNPVTENFGALAPILGTVVTALIAMLIAIPVSLGVALFQTEICPNFLKKVLGILIELLAGIPSIIYGMWGLFVLAPLFSDSIQPWLIDHLSPIAVIGPFFQGAPLGIGVLTASIILGIMIIPFITSVWRDAFSLVPNLLKESAYAVGATQWEVAKNIILPYCKTSMIGGAILGLGRAIGETMAVAFVIGNSHQLFNSLFMPGSTISSVLANEFSEATGKIYTASLNELGLILFLSLYAYLALPEFSYIK